MMGLAVMFGIGAAIVAVRLAQSAARPLIAEEADHQVAVAARDLELGAVLRSEDIRLIDWPSSSLPQGYSGNPATLIGRGVMAPVTTNEPLLDSKLAGKGSGGGLPIIIPDGMRGISVKVDEVIGVAGFVLPGTRVDVVVVVEPRGSGGEPTSRVILQNVRVLAAGQSIQHDAEGKPQTVTVITLMVTPQEAELLALASNQGRIQLALRNTLDTAEAPTPGALLANLSSSRRPQVTARDGTRQSSNPAESGRKVVEMYRGGQRTLTTFRNGSQ